VVDQQARAGVRQQRHQVHQLIALDLYVGVHVQAGEVGQQPGRAGVVIHAVQGRVDGDADDAGRPQRAQVAGRGVDRYDGHPAPAIRRAGQGVEQAPVVGAVPGVRSDQERVGHAVRVADRAVVRGRAELRAGGGVEGVRLVGKPDRLEHVDVTVDLRLVENSHRRDGIHRRSRVGRLCWPAEAARCYIGTMVPVDRTQTGLRIERNLLKVLKGLAEYLDLSLGDLVEGIALYAFEGKPPFSAATIAKIEQLKAVYGLELTAADAHRLEEQ
jgi:hypothetical protein